MSETTGVTAAPTTEAGPRTDRLELLQQLGSGGVGVVHKAKNPKLDRLVALRQMQVPEWLDDAEDLLKQILAQAKAASGLDHPNIARLYTGGYKNFTVFLTSEFIDGPGLKEYVAARNCGVPEIIALARQLCAALDYAHEKGVVHQALTLANIKVLPSGDIKILDFGVMRDKNVYSPTPAKRLENEHYLSPEQLKHKPVDRFANLFTAAAIIYEILTTRSPFLGKHLGEVDRNIVDVEPHPASMAHPRVPEGISRVLAKALFKNPRDRYQSGKELAAALDEALNGAPTAKTPAVSKSPAAANRTGSIPVQPSAPPAKPAAAAAVAATGSAASGPKTGSFPVQPSTAPAPAAPVAAAVKPAPSKPATAEPAGPITQTIRPPQPPKPPATAVRTAAPAKLPARLAAQWKLAGIIVAGLFVVSALALSLSHRSKVAAPEATRESQPSAAPQGSASASAPDSSAAATAPVELKEIQPHARKEKGSHSEPPPVAAPAPTEGQISITSAPDGATIEIGGHTLASWKTPQTVTSLAPGVYQITISKAGFASEKRSVEVQAGGRASLDVKLTPTQSYLTVVSNPPGARILIDGKETGKFSPADFTLEPASHNVTLHKDGYFDTTTDIKLAPGQNFSYSPSMTAAGRTDNIKVMGGGFKKLFGGGSSAGMSRIEIKTDPKDAQVIINGTSVPKTTPMEIQLEPGNYEMVLQKDGYKPLHKTFTAQANDKLKFDEKLSK